MHCCEGHFSPTCACLHLSGFDWSNSWGRQDQAGSRIKAAISMDRGFPAEQTRITTRDFPFPTSLLHIPPQRPCSDSDPRKSLQLTSAAQLDLENERRTFVQRGNVLQCQFCEIFARDLLCVINLGQTGGRFALGGERLLFLLQPTMYVISANSSKDSSTLAMYVISRNSMTGPYK